jgi:hypothetical protein
MDIECPMCGLPVRVYTPQPDLNGNTARVDPGYRTWTCKRCGEYRVSIALGWPPIISEELKPLLSAAARQGAESGVPILLDKANLEEIAAPHRSVTISQRVEKTLHFVAARCKRPGEQVQIDFEMDYPVSDCLTGDELRACIEFLSEEQLLNEYEPQHLHDVMTYAPTMGGWQAVEPTLPTEGEPDRCFVAMWFNDEMDPVYKSGFAKAIEECGFKPYLDKEYPTNKSIMDRILSEIRRARFVVADFTGHRQSVYYEAGFARGIGREVIGCCREDEIQNLTFDTRHLGHVVWKDAADLRQKLADSIRANIIPKR